MSAYLYIWNRNARQWEFRDILPTEELARAKGRELWKAGAAGVKIDVLTTVVENIRPVEPPRADPPRRARPTRLDDQ